MKHLVLAVVILMALATVASAATVCTGAIVSGDTCTVGNFSIVWDAVLLSPGGTASVAVTNTASFLSTAFTLTKSGTVNYTVTPVSYLGLMSVELTRQLASDATKQINGVSPILEVEKLTPINTASMNYKTALGAPIGVTDTITGTVASFGATNNLTFVPEPATFALMGVGLLGLGLIRRRKA